MFGLVGVSLLSVVLLYLAPSSSPAPNPPAGGGNPYDDGSNNLFLSTFRAVWRCVQVLGIGFAVLFAVGASIWAYESVASKLGTSEVKGEEDRWEDKDVRKKNRARLRHGRQHGLLPIIVLLIGLIASSFIDASVLNPTAFFSSSSSLSTASAPSSSTAGSALFALLTIAAIVGSSIFLKRDWNLWRAGKRAGPTGATQKAAEATTDPTPSTSTGQQTIRKRTSRRLRGEEVELKEL